MKRHSDICRKFSWDLVNVSLVKIYSNILSVNLLPQPTNSWTVMHVFVLIFCLNVYMNNTLDLGSRPLSLIVQVPTGR